MTILKKRSRIVSFRVSEEEYQALQELTAKKGAHSVSDLARLLAFTSSGRQSSLHAIETQAQIHDLRAKVHDLVEEVQRLHRRIEEGSIPAGQPFQKVTLIEATLKEVPAPILLGLLPQES